MFFLACALIVGCLPSVRGQDAIRERIHQQATDLLTYFRTQQDGRFVDLMYPKMIEMAGSREKMLAVLKSAEDEMKNSGFKIDSVEIGEAGAPVVSGNKQYSIVPQTLRMTGPTARIESTSYLLAVSTDNGKTWTFVDGAGLNPETLKLVLPDFPPEMKLPGKKQPKVTPLS